MESTPSFRTAQKYPEIAAFVVRELLPLTVHTYAQCIFICACTHACVRAYVIAHTDAHIRVSTENVGSTGEAAFGV